MTSAAAATASASASSVSVPSGSALLKVALAVKKTVSAGWVPRYSFAGAVLKLRDEYAGTGPYTYKLRDPEPWYELLDPELWY